MMDSWSGERRSCGPQSRNSNRKQCGYGASLTGPDRACPARRPWLWSCGGAGRPVVRSYLWRGLRSDNYRGDTAFAVRYRARGVPVATRLACFVPWDSIGASRVRPLDVSTVLAPDVSWGFLYSLCIGGRTRRASRQFFGKSRVGHDAPHPLRRDKSRPVAPAGRGAHLQQQQSVQWHSSGPRRRAQS